MNIDFDWLETELDGPLDENERSILQQVVKVEFVTEGGSVIHQNSNPGALYLLHSGSVDVQGRSVRGKDVMLTRNSRIKVLGEISFFSSKPASASVIADRPCVLYKIGHVEFERLMREQPALVMKIFSLIVRNMGDIIVQQDAKLRIHHFG